MAINYELINKGGISLGTNFELLSEKPLDSRLVVPSLTGLQNYIDNAAAYEGMIVFDKTTKKTYQVQTIDGILSYREFGLTEDELKNLIASETTAAMEFKGAATALPENPSKGDMWKVTATFKIDDADVKIGDSIVYSGEEWFIIPSGDDIEDTWRPIEGVDNDATLKFKDGNKLDVAVASDGTITYSHEAIEAPELLAENEQTRTYITAVETDGYGHITGYKTATENVEDTNTEYTFESQVESSSVYFNVTPDSEGATEQTVYVDAYSKNEVNQKVNALNLEIYGTETPTAETVSRIDQAATDAGEAKEAAQAAQEAAEEASGALTEAGNAAEAAQAAQAAAEAAAGRAETAEGGANSAKEAAETAAGTASSKADEAAGSASAANTSKEAAAGSATAAAESASTAATKAGDAEAARAAAVTAKEAAELAETNAETAEANAKLAQTSAEAAQGAAEGSATAAAGSASAAEESASAASTAQTKAEAAQAAAEQAKADAEAAKQAALDSNTSATAIANEAKEVADEAKQAAEGAVATANTALQSITVGDGLKISEKGETTTQLIEIDDTVVFILNCN